MCGPNFCSMKITQDVREYAKSKGISDDAAIEQGMEEKAKEFSALGHNVYQDHSDHT